MLKYIGKRILTMIPVLLGVSFIIFLIMDLAPGNPAISILGENATKEDIAALEEERGLNENVVIRYVKYIGDIVLHGDFGNSWMTKLPVQEELFTRLPTTLNVAIGSIIIMLVVGVPIGVLSAVKQYTLIDTASLFTAMFLTSMPSFFFGLLMMLVFALNLGWLPATGNDTWMNYILPCCTLAVNFLAQLIRMTRSNMLEVIRADYIRTARSKGTTEKTIVYKHALRNALLPVITIVGLNFSAMLGGGPVIESVFALPGLGTMLVNGVRMKDTPSVMAAVLFSAVMISVINLLVDIIYMFVDPRLKSSFVK